MGYEINIRREDESNKLTKGEWRDYVDTDPEFKAIEEFSAEVEDGTLTIPTPDGGIWKSDKGNIPFTFYEKYGEVTVKNPDNWVIEKMISIANSLDSVVIGEEGEIYDEQYLSEPHVNPADRVAIEKKWWEFWK